MSRYFGFLVAVLGLLLALRLAPTLAADAPNTDAGKAAPSDVSLPDDTTPSDAEKHLLRYRFRLGEVVRSKVVQQTKIETTIAGSTQAAEMTSISTKAWRVTNVADDGRITFDTMIEAVDMRQQMSGRQEVRYNSKTDPKPPPGYESAAASVGKLLTTITIDPTGKLLRREKKNQVGVDNLNTQIVVPLPQEPVAVGEPWSVPLDVAVSLDGIPGNTKTLTVKNRYQVEKVENGVAFISVQTVLPPVNDPRIRAQLIQRMTKGTIRFDINAGRVLSQHTDLDEQVIGFSGPNSSLQYVGRFSEELIADNPQASGERALKR
ncbi:MAG: hypothetical protein WD894_17415 [Pirellulales bacterium]